MIRSCFSSSLPRTLCSIH